VQGQKGTTMNWYLEVLKKYRVFSGRANRKEYWMFFLVHYIVLYFSAIFIALIAAIFWVTIGGSFGITVNTSDSFAGAFDNVFTAIFSILIYIHTISTISVGVRRMHDTDHSGWWLLFPIVNLVFAVSEGTQGDNRFGADPRIISIAKLKERKDIKGIAQFLIAKDNNIRELAHYNGPQKLDHMLRY
jgi:uncharacterized membrane protein YhaH (DUF805 family)